MPELLTEARIIAIYRETVGPLYGFVSRKCDGDRAMAEDITQDTWLRAVREWRRAGLPENPLGWLTTVARNLLLNQLRRRAAVPLDEVAPEALLAAMSVDGAGDAPPDAEATAARIRAALTRLRPDEARLLEDFHFARRRMAQLADQHGISERAVEGRLRRAREHLRRELELAMPLTDGGLP